MKKLVFYILLLSGSLMMACSDTSSSTEAGDYINPGFAEKDVSTVKAYSGFSSGCTGSGCQAIIYSGKINGTNYVGIAIKESSYNFKLYWPATSIPTGTVSIGPCTIKQNSDSETNITISNVTFTNNNPTSNTYTIAFGTGITSTTINIPAGSITAQLY